MDFDEDDLEAMAAAVAQLPSELRQVAARMQPPVLHSACAAGEIDLVRALLDAGLAPDTYPCTEDEDDDPPLTWIARYRDTSSPGALAVAALLIERGAGVDEGLPLLAAIEAQDGSLIRMLLAAGADTELALEDATPKQAAFFHQVIDGDPLPIRIDFARRGGLR